MGQTAKELLELLEQYGDDEKRLLWEHRNLEYFYALSDIRENLLEWFPFTPDCHLLQIGSDCGALTGLFARKCGNVTVLDRDEEDLKVNQRRHGTSEHIRYLAGSMEQLENAGERFEYVAMIGSIQEPFQEMVEKGKGLLKENGIFLIAVDNPQGLKHWAGAPGEGCGVGRKRLEEAFPGGTIYYPFPDYKTAAELYTDRRLPAKGDLTGTVISYDYPEFLRTDVGASWDSICEEGRFPDFSNSYLMVWRKHG